MATFVPLVTASGRETRRSHATTSQDPTRRHDDHIATDDPSDAPLALKEALSALEPHLNCPHYTTSSLRWSLPSTAAGTLFLEHVEDCSIEQQHLLRDWLDDASRRLQVITTTERSLFDLVERGGFLSALYYRLNTIHLNLGSGP